MKFKITLDTIENLGEKDLYCSINGIPLVIKPSDSITMYNEKSDKINWDSLVFQTPDARELCDCSFCSLERTIRDKNCLCSCGEYE